MMATADLYCEGCGSTNYQRCSYRRDHETGKTRWLCDNCGRAPNVVMSSYPGSDDAREGDDWGGSAL